MQEAALVLEYNKELDSFSQNFNRYMGGQKDFSFNISINNSTYDFDLSHNEYDLYWSRYPINRQSAVRSYTP